MKRTLLTILLFALATGFAYAEEKPATPFNGKNLEGWKPVDADAKCFWTAGIPTIDEEEPINLIVQTIPEGKKGALVNAKSGDWHQPPRGVDLYSMEQYGDCTVDLEFMVSKDSNSGIYIMGEYEVQVLDSYGREEMGPADVGALYGAAPPKVNASLPPGKWQHFVIEFEAPKFDENGKKISNARFVKITLNGKVVQADVEMPGPTPGGVTGEEAPTGPLMFQGNHGPVAYRNIKVFTKGSDK